MRTRFLPSLLPAVVVIVLGVAAAGKMDKPNDGAPATGKEDSRAMKLALEHLHDVFTADSPKVIRTDEEWKKLLTPEQFRITRRAATEAPFCGTLLDNHKTGTYSCVGCGLPLFSSRAKFNSGTGWPSFFEPVRKEHIEERTDRSFGMARTEILCARCGAHLGHVFDDGPKPTGLRYCLNSEALVFVENRTTTP